MMKPMLASDYDEKKLRFPCFVQPKIDGVRGLTTEGGLTGRSLKQHKNVYNTEFWSQLEYRLMDGELAAEDECHPDLCRITSSAMSTIEGEPYTLWHVFDFLHPEVIDKPYLERYDALKAYVERHQRNVSNSRLRLVPNFWAHDMETLLALDDQWLDMGYEGSIIRDPYGMHKEGRSTVKEMGLLRIKRFTEEDAVVLSIVEGERNDNEAQKNELGHTFRTSHQENKVLNGMVGALICKDIKTGNEILVSAGKLTHEERKFYFENQSRLIGQTVKYKFFPKGIKDKPRFPTFQSIRDSSDISC
jgi:DNA ligase-1